VKEVIQKNCHLDVSLSNPGEISNLVGLLIRAGAQVEEVHKNRARIEDVFLKLMQDESNGA